MGIILSVFKGCGRTYFKGVDKGKTKIFDAVVGLENGLPEDYVDRVMEKVPDNDIVFINSDKIVRDAFNQRGINYDLFYPSKERKIEFVENLVRKRLSSSEIRDFDRNFDKMVDEIDDEESDNYFKHKLVEKGHFLANDGAIMSYVNGLHANNSSNKKEVKSESNRDDGSK